MKNYLKINFGNRDALAELMPKINPLVTVDKVASLCYGKRKDGSEYIDQRGLIAWFEAEGVKVKHKYKYSECLCGIDGCQNIDDVYYVYSKINPYNACFV